MAKFNIGDPVYAIVDGCEVECEIYEIPDQGGTVYKLYCQGEVISRAAGEFREVNRDSR